MVETNTYFILGYLLGTDAAFVLGPQRKKMAKEPEIHLHTRETQHRNPALIGRQTN